jgi:galactonate dehydratase
MRVTAVRTVVVNATAHTNWIFVVVETDEGIAGVGEATLIGHERLVADAVEGLGSALVGADPLQAVALTQPFQAGLVAAAALSGVEQALWDIRGKAYGVPVHRLLGGGSSAVPVYATSSRTWRESKRPP